MRDDTPQGEKFIFHSNPNLSLDSIVSTSAHTRNKMKIFSLYCVRAPMLEVGPDPEPPEPKDIANEGSNATLAPIRRDMIMMTAFNRLSYLTDHVGKWKFGLHDPDKT